MQILEQEIHWDPLALERKPASMVCFKPFVGFIQSLIALARLNSSIINRHFNENVEMDSIQNLLKAIN